MSWRDKYAREELVPLDKVKIDYSYQPGEEERGAVVRKPEDFVRAFATGILVSRRDDGYYYPFDGTRRYRGALLAGEEAMPMQVFEGMTVAEEAEGFVAVNKNRKPITPEQIHRAGLEAGHPTSLAVQRVLDGAAVSTRAFRAWATAYRMVETYGERVFAEAVCLIYNAWRGDEGSFEAPVVRAVSTIIGRWGREVDQDRLTRVLSNTGSPVLWLGRAKSLTLTHGGVSAKLELLIRAEYNKRMRRNALTTARERTAKARELNDL